MKMKNLLYIISGFVILFSVLFFSGPVVDTDFKIKTIDLPEDLDKYLKTSEERFNDITPGAEKEIIWAGEKGVKTKYSIVYLHGFSACRKETWPLSDNIAEKLSANLFYTRFTGHGRSGTAMTDGNVNAWINDGYEALKIGEKIGKKIIVIGVSTGGTIATILSSVKESKNIESFILISPNYSPKNNMTKLMLLPWGNKIAELVIGKERSWDPDNELHGKYWTHKYPTSALLPMMGLVSLAGSIDLTKVKTPSLFIYSPEDQIVDTGEIVKNFKKLGSEKKKLVLFSGADDSSRHVLAGDILSPNGTEKVEKIIVTFLNGIEN